MKITTLKWKGEVGDCIREVRGRLQLHERSQRLSGTAVAWGCFWVFFWNPNRSCETATEPTIALSRSGALVDVITTTSICPTTKVFVTARGLRPDSGRYWLHRYKCKQKLPLYDLLSSEMQNIISISLSLNLIQTNPTKKKHSTCLIKWDNYH